LPLPPNIYLTYLLSWMAEKKNLYNGRVWYSFQATMSRTKSIDLPAPSEYVYAYDPRSCNNYMPLL